MNRALAAVLISGAALAASAAAPAFSSAASLGRPRPGKIRGEPAPESRRDPGPPLHAPSTTSIFFVWPPEGMQLSADAEFVFGSVFPATGTLTINGMPVPVHKDGGFIAFLPITQGSFAFRAELAADGTTYMAERTIFVPPPPVAIPPGKAKIDPASLSPRADLDLRPGDWLTARLRGAPGMPARFKVGKRPWTDMRETSAGSYEGALQIAPGESFDPAPVEYELGEGWGRAKEKGTARVSASDRAPAVGVVKANSAGFANVKTGPSNGFLVFPLPGARLSVTGRDGGAVRVRLSDTLSGWMESKDLELIAGAAPPRAVSGVISATRTVQGAMLRVGLSDRVPFDVVSEPETNSLTLRLFSTVGHTNLALNDATDMIRELRWKQEESDVVAVKAIFQPGVRLWGWSPQQDGGGLKLQLRRAPSIDPRQPLRGVRVLLDPGHMPSATGATGPLGTKEMDANYAIAVSVKARLERGGATVLMTRADALHEVSLVDRPRQAVERGADLFVSIHNNALPDGENPFSRPHGFSVFYYHPQSLELGRAVHESFKSRIRLADEGLRWGNLLVARVPAMPSILVENAYMIFPEQEAMLNDQGFRDELAGAIAAGLERFLSDEARRQRP